MLRFAVCDDQTFELKMLGKLLECYQQKRDCKSFQTDFYASSAKLLQRLSNGTAYDLYILDMMMPEYNGVEVGRKIRMNKQDSVIIYITASPDFALDAISIHPEQYLLKPIHPACLYQTLDNVIAHFDGREDLFFPVKTRGGLEQLPYREIVCIEHAERVMRVFTADGKFHESIYLRGSFGKLMEPVLCQSDFIQTHQSYLVNLRYARSLQTGSLWMNIGIRVPVSRRNAADVRQRFFRDTRQQGKKFEKSEQ